MSEKEELWEEIKTLTTKAARIKAKRDTDWYLRALKFMHEAENRLLAGLAEAITAWRTANGLDERKRITTMTEKAVEKARAKARQILVEDWPQVRALAQTKEGQELLARVANAFELLLLADDVEQRRRNESKKE